MIEIRAVRHWFALIQENTFRGLQAEAPGIVTVTVLLHRNRP